MRLGRDSPVEGPADRLDLSSIVERDYPGRKQVGAHDNSLFKSLGAIEPLRDDAFEAMHTGRPAKGFAIATFMIRARIP